MVITGTHIAIIGTMFICFALGRGKEARWIGNGRLAELLIGIVFLAVPILVNITINITFGAP